jgi:hypothetical protein
MQLGNVCAFPFAFIYEQFRLVDCTVYATCNCDLQGISYFSRARTLLAYITRYVFLYRMLEISA